MDDAGTLKRSVLRAVGWAGATRLVGQLANWAMTLATVRNPGPARLRADGDRHGRHQLSGVGELGRLCQCDRAEPADQRRRFAQRVRVRIDHERGQHRAVVRACPCRRLVLRRAPPGRPAAGLQPDFHCHCIPGDPAGDLGKKARSEDRVADRSGVECHWRCGCPDPCLARRRRVVADRRRIDFRFRADDRPVSGRALFPAATLHPAQPVRDLALRQLADCRKSALDDLFERRRLYYRQAARPANSRGLFGQPLSRGVAGGKAGAGDRPGGPPRFLAGCRATVPRRWGICRRRYGSSPYCRFRCSSAWLRHRPSSSPSCSG